MKTRLTEVGEFAYDGSVRDFLGDPKSAGTPIHIPNYRDTDTFLEDDIDDDVDDHVPGYVSGDNDMLGPAHYIPVGVSMKTEAVNRIIESLLDDEPVEEMTTTGDIAIYPGGFEVDDEDLPTPEDTEKTGVSVVGIKKSPRIK